MATESRGAIVTAAGANLAIAIAKFAGAWLTGSSAMLSEGVHSLVDTSNQVLLLVGLKRAEKPADRTHPFGHGREVYFFSFVVALLIFSAGGVYSLYEGWEKVRHPEKIGDVDWAGLHLPGFAVNLAVLGFALIAEGYSLYKAYSALPEGSGSTLSTIRRSKDPSLFVVIVEDAAAVAGLVLAIIGVSLAEWLGMPAFDGAASICIGLVLIAMAAFLMVETHGLLIGEAADPAVMETIRELVRDEPIVRQVNEILTQHLGPSDILVNVSLNVADWSRGHEIERLTSRLERELKQRHRAVRRVFIEFQAPQHHEASPGPQAGNVC